MKRQLGLSAVPLLVAMLHGCNEILFADFYIENGTTAGSSGTGGSGTGTSGTGGPAMTCTPGFELACYSGPQGTQNVGACRAGTITCNAEGTAYGPCVGEILPACDDCATLMDETCGGDTTTCNGDHVWSKRFGGASDQTVSGLAVDSAGNIIVTGTFFDTIDFGGGPLYSAGDCDLFLAKLDANGAHVWSKRFGDDGDTCGAGDVALDSLGNVIFSGQFGGTIDFGGVPLSSAGQDDAMLALFSPDGEHIWSKRFGGTGQDGITAVSASSDGNIAVAGASSGPLDLGGGDLPSGGGGKFDIVVALFDAQGKHQWGHRFGTPDHEAAWRVVVDGAGDIAIAGNAHATIDLGGGPRAITDSDSFPHLFVAKYQSTNGDHVWSNVFDGAMTTGDQLALDPSGNLLVGGRLSGTANFGGGPHFAAEGVYFAKMDSGGNDLGSIAVDGAAFLPGFSVDDCGNLIAATALGSKTIGSFGPADFGGGPITRLGVLVKFDAALQHVWSKSIIDSPDDSLYWLSRVGTDARGNIVVAGSFEKSIDLGGGTRVSGGGWDVFVARFAP